MVASSKQRLELAQAANKLLLEAGDSLRSGDTLKPKGSRERVSATDLADSGSEIPATRRSKKLGGINLRSVAEVLEAEGLDPTAEIVKVLPELDADLRARIMMELLNYVAPKLKAVEMKTTIEGKVDSNVNLNVNFTSGSAKG